jgi:hypothetical protein
VFAQEAPLPEGNAYVRGMLSGPRSQDNAINDYTYDIEEVYEDLDKSGKTTSRVVRRYEVYYVQTRPIRRLVSKNGIPLGAKEQAEVDRKAETLAKAIVEGKTVSEQPGIRLAALLGSLEFKTVGREEREGRATLVFDFAAQKGAKPKGSDGAADALGKILTGRLHVDETDRRVVLLDARNVPGEKAGMILAMQISTLELAVEYASVGKEVWLPKRTVTLAAGRAFLFKGFRFRRTNTYSNYRRFKVDTEERPVR